MANPKTARVVVVDDHSPAAAAVRAAIAAKPDMEVAAVASDSSDVSYPQGSYSERARLPSYLGMRENHQGGQVQAC